MTIITDFDSDFVNRIDFSPNQAYILAVFKLQSTVSSLQDTVTLRLKHTPFNVQLTKLIFTDLSVTNPPHKIPIKSSGTYKYINIQFKSKTFTESLCNFNITKLHHNLHCHILRAIIEMKFKLNNNSLQAKVSNQYLTFLITHIIYHPASKHNITSLHIRTTKNSTCIRFKLYPNDNTLTNYLYPPDIIEEYIHNPLMVDTIHRFNSYPLIQTL